MSAPGKGCALSITDAGALADTAGYSPDLNFAQKLQLLETFDVVDRLTLALQFQRERLAELQVRKGSEGECDIVLRELYPAKSDLYDRARALLTEFAPGS